MQSEDRPRVLVVSPNASVLRLLLMTLEYFAFPEFVGAHGQAPAVEALETFTPEVIVYHFTATGEVSIPIDFLRHLRERYATARILVVTAWGNVTREYLIEQYGVRVDGIILQPLNPFALLDDIMAADGVDRGRA